MEFRASVSVSVSATVSATVSVASVNKALKMLNKKKRKCNIYTRYRPLTKERPCVLGGLNGLLGIT